MTEIARYYEEIFGIIEILCQQFAKFVLSGCIDGSYQNWHDLDTCTFKYLVDIRKMHLDTVLVFVFGFRHGGKSPR